MGRGHFKPEQIIYMLREAEVKLADGKITGKICRVLGQARSKQRRTLVVRDDEDAFLGLVNGGCHAPPSRR
jgi:hypothetical protein